MAHVDDQRVARVLDALEAQHPGAQLLVNDPWSIYYLTGFYADMFERFCGVLLTRGAEPVILVNALHQLPEYDNARVAYHTDTDIVTDAIAREVDPTKPLGIDTVMRSGFLMPLMERHAASEFFLGDFAVTAARTHKDATEQELMRASSTANDAVMADAIKLVHEGVTEREIADQMLGLYRKHGCEGFSFPPIVSFGANAGDPHHEPDDTELKRAVNLRRLVGTLDARNACGEIDEALGDNHGRGEHGVRSVGGLELAGRDAGDSNDETGDAQNKINQGKDFESLASEAHGWSFRYEYANLAHPLRCTYGEAHCSSTRRCMRLKATLACAAQPFKKESWA